MTVFGCFFGLMALRGQSKKSVGKTGLEHKKLIANEDFVSSLITNRDLIGNSISRFQDIPQAADYTFVKGSAGEVQLPLRLTLMTPDYRTCPVFAEMFSDSESYIEPKLKKGDTVHWFLGRPSKLPTLEGPVGVGGLVFCRNDVVVAIAEGTSYIPH